jgi:hypothetical protein
LGERFPYKEEVAGSSSAPPILHTDLGPPLDCATRVGVYDTESSQATEGGKLMLWLIAGVVLLVIAIAGGAIIHPILFALGILALLIFFTGTRGTRTI